MRKNNIQHLEIADMYCSILCAQSKQHKPLDLIRK